MEKLIDYSDSENADHELNKALCDNFPSRDNEFNDYLKSQWHDAFLEPIETVVEVSSTRST